MKRLIGTIAAVVVLATGNGPVASQPACRATAPDMLGPFYVANAPQRDRTGDGLTVHGAVRSARDCSPLPKAQIEWWSANRRGEYDDARRATQFADAGGTFRYVTDMPGRYPGRPPHVHVKVSAPGHRTLVTQIYPQDGQGEIAFDFVLQPN
jgi:protocatechuate 3,4-dioxygenase beta subunit